MEPEIEMILHPFSVHLDPISGIVDNPDNHIKRYLSKIVDTFHDKSAAEGVLKDKGDSLIYEVYEKKIPQRSGELQFCSSITHPGKIGYEYFMTKGHFHVRRDRAEIYYCLRGLGIILMEKENGEHAVEALSPGRVVYVPGYFAHRSINTGAEPLISLAVYPGDSGHDYGSIEVSGFKHIVLERRGQPEIIEKERAFDNNHSLHKELTDEWLQQN